VLQVLDVYLETFEHKNKRKKLAESLCENHDYVPALSELITLGFFLKFKNEEIDFLMESKYLQIDHEDEKFLSSAFPSD
jgi:hypothetical protein